MKHDMSVRWLRLACVVTIVTGGVSAAASLEALDEAWRLLFDALRWPIDGDPAGFDREGRALNAVLGGVLVGWGATMFSLTRSSLASDGPGLARVVLVGLTAWYAVDSAGSFAAGIPGNVVLNTAFLVMFLPPLLSLRREASDAEHGASAG